MSDVADATAMSNTEIEKGLGSLFATQYLDADKQDAPKAPKAAPKVAPMVEGTDDAEDLAATDGEHAEAEAAEDEVPEGEEQAEATEVEEFALDLKVDGADYRVTDRAEAVKLAQLGKHFTQKNEALIRDKQAFEAERKKGREDARRYADALPQVEAFLRMPLGEAPKREAFPDELSYLKADKAHREALQGVENVRAEWQRVQQEQAAEQAEALRAWIAEQDQQILAEIPEWNDHAVRDTEWREMVAYARTRGATESAFQNPLLAHDKAFRLILRDAMRYRKAADAGAAEVRKAPTRDAKPGSGPQAQPRDRKRREIEARAKAGSAKDQEFLLDQLMVRQAQLKQPTKR